jgi:hypothetical protein
MSDLNQDPIINAIKNGIKDDIDYNWKDGRHRATLLLMFATIDAMAFLNMPASQSDVSATDFIDWIDKYLRFTSCQTQLTGIDLYGARRGILNTYSLHSIQPKMSRDVLYLIDSPGDPVRENGDPKQVVVSIAGLKTALFTAIDRFLIDVFTSPDRAKVAAKRLPKLMIAYDCT